ncbi:UDP-N-acetylmuramate dehydrogenase [uncultured Muribaculum sp.]|uniref:UDP-N-acetylmuramate dehydrogenase n=1 Tax=uncultured Muribaculum sp. TaxID=1918613 RepID=UPI0025D6F39B|nr:UDP-N-acetylmuramate dehydrogenase [uncultured Muribaculum sp.]
MNLQQNFDLASVTTFHIPARARYYASYSSVNELKRLLDMPELRSLPVMHMGGGSNLLFTRDYPGVVLHSDIRGINFHPDPQNDTVVYAVAAAGERWDSFVETACRAGYAGIENLSLIPGSVGAAAVQNIGAYGVELADRLHSVEVYDTFSAEVVELPRERLAYGYRQSLFKQPEVAGRYVVTAVTVRLSTLNDFHLDYGPLRELSGNPALSPADVRRRVIDIRRAKLPDPDVEGNAGSFFKNPVVDKAKFHSLLGEYPDMPYYILSDGDVKIPAGWLIEHAGMKGARVGGARVYQRQCLVIVNTGSAVGADVVALSRKVQEEVMRVFGLELHPEVIFI